MPKKIIAIFTLSAVILSAAACSRPSEISESTTAGETTLSSESLPASEPESAPVTLLPEEMTEEQLRSALSALGTSDDDNLQKPVFYRELRARDALSEADYTDWAEISGQLGDQTTQREILLELYYLYPTVLHAQQLGQTIFRITSETPEMLSLAEEAVQTLSKESPYDFMTLVHSEQWKQLFWLAGGAVTDKAFFDSPEGQVRISSDALGTEISILSGEELHFIRCDETGCLSFSGGWRDQSFQGECKASFYDTSCNLTQQMEALLENGAAADSVKIVSKKKEYIGKPEAFQSVTWDYWEVD